MILNLTEREIVDLAEWVEALRDPPPPEVLSLMRKERGDSMRLMVRRLRHARTPGGQWTEYGEAHEAATLVLEADAKRAAAAERADEIATLAAPILAGLIGGARFDRVADRAKHVEAAVDIARRILELSAKEPG